MGKKGNWFSALRKAFTSSSKDNLIANSEKKNVKEKKKWRFVKSKNGEVNAFIPPSREPSSIEKILGDAEREQQHNIQREAPKKAEHNKAHHQEPYFKQHHQETNVRAHHQESHFKVNNDQEPLRNVLQLRAPKQKSNVARNKRGITQNLAQVSATRIQAVYRGYMTIAEADEEWDDSVLTKKERDARTQRKVEAVIKRERALAYAYSHQLLKVTPKSAHAVLTDIRFGGFPLWWNWLDRQLRHEPNLTPLPKTPTELTPKFTSSALSSVLLLPNSHTRPKILIHDILDVPTPRSSITTLRTPRAKLPSNVSKKWRQTKLRDDESLTSCPAFRAVPNYMQPTVSAQAKVRDSHVADIESRGGDKKRSSLSLTQSVGFLRRSGKHRPTSSVGGLSVDSTVSLPMGVGKKPFK